MPDTPNFAITYPCEGVPVDCDDFGTFATDVEAAFVTVDGEATSTTHLPYALQTTSTAAIPFGVATLLTFTAAASNANSGVTVGANAFTVVTPGLYLTTIQSRSADSTLTLTSGRVGMLKNFVTVDALKRKPIIGLPSVSGMSLSVPINVVAGDTISWQFLWTGTGALTANFVASVFIQLLSTP